MSGLKRYLYRFKDPVQEKFYFFQKGDPACPPSFKCLLGLLYPWILQRMEILLPSGHDALSSMVLPGFATVRKVEVSHVLYNPHQFPELKNIKLQLK